MLRSVDQLLEAVEEYGFLPFFKNSIKGFSVEETADILKLSVSAVKMRLMRGRQMLKNKIEKERIIYEEEIIDLCFNTYNGIYGYGELRYKG